MILRFNNYKSGYKIVSLAFTESTYQDLKNNNLDFIYIHDGHIFLLPANEELFTDLYNELSRGNDYDAYEISPDGKLSCCYNSSSIDNYFFLTESCNSNCIMCPMPETIRKRGHRSGTDNLIEIARHIPSNTPHLTITGGEPFMIGEGIFDFFRFLRDKFQDTEVLLLTNGRVFAIDRIARLAKETLPTNTIIGIPIHSSNAQLHDTITQTAGSFFQTVAGIKNMLHLGSHIELRVVVSRLNMYDFKALADFIIQELSNIEYVCIIAMEMTGNAYTNRDRIWEPYSHIFKTISSAVMTLIQHGINVKLYNFPLCTVDKNFWAICSKSISPEKVRYVAVCPTCKMKDACGGIFAGTVNLEKSDLKPLL